MGWQVALTDEAEDDLKQVVSFLAQKSPEAAERIGLETIEILFSLDELPSRGAPMRNRSWLRKLPHRHYLIIFQVNEEAKQVEIIRIWDNRQNPAKLLLR